MKLELTKTEQDKIGGDIVSLKKEVGKVLEKYNFEFDGMGSDLKDGSFEMFWYSKE